MDFLHLADAIDLRLLAAASRPLVGADFEFSQDQFVACMVAAWDGNEVIITQPLEASLPESVSAGKLTEHNAAADVTLAVKRAAEDSHDAGYWQQDYAASIATTLVTTFDKEVLHSKTWEIDRAQMTFWSRRYQQEPPAIQPTCTVLGPIQVPIAGRLWRGELISIPYATRKCPRDSPRPETP